MPKVLTITGLAVAAIVLVVFALDLIVGWPFDKARPGGMMMDLGFIVASLMLAYMSWSAFRELA
ncbi:MAG: hypothetical protein U0836_13125 [Pirellulales bacterium]|jgi:hypothetical protein